MHPSSNTRVNTSISITTNNPRARQMDIKDEEEPKEIPKGVLREEIAANQVQVYS